MIKRLFLLFALIGFSITYAGIFELYGIGSIGINYSTAAAGRGRTSVAYTDSMNINFQNPALTAYISGAGLAMSASSRHNDVRGVGNTNNYSGFNYGNIKIPLADAGGFVLGLKPLSTADASLRIEKNDVGYTETTDINGNIYAVSANAAYSFFDRRNLAIGAGFDLLAGGFTVSNTIEFTDSTLKSVYVESDQSYNGTQLNAGLLYSPFRSLTAGASWAAVITNSKRIIRNFMVNGTNSFYSHIDTMSAPVGSVIFPNRMSFGLALDILPDYTISVDYVQYGFKTLTSDFSINPLYETAGIGNYIHIGAGVEKQGHLSKYIPYYQSLTYRGGLYYDEHYVQNANGIPVKTYGVTLGLGLPFTEFRNRIDLAFSAEYNNGTVYDNNHCESIDAKEFVFKFDIGILISETWFNTKGKFR